MTGTDRQHVHERLESELSVLWRLQRRLSIDLAQQVDDTIEVAAYGLLGALADGDVRAADLAGRLGLDKSTVSRHVAQTEARGLIQRVPDPQDGRARLIHLTDEGRSRLRQLRAARGRRLGQAMEHWPAAEVDALVALLRRLNESLFPA